MRHERNNVLVLYKKHSREARELAYGVSAWLNAKNMETRVCESGDDDILAVKPVCAVVLGGDGTILGLSRRLVGKDIPVFGINFGKVGFLTIASKNAWRQKLESALEGRIPIWRCLALNWHVERHGARVGGGVAVNDLVLSRSSLARLVCARIFINGENMGVLRSDGLIVCTPLGSSGYSVSAGGSLLYAPMDAIGLTPICPFMTNISPLVFPGDIRFELLIEPASVECYVTIDGQEGQRLEGGDIVHVSGRPDSIWIFTDDANFFSRLRTRGFMLENI